MDAINMDHQEIWEDEARWYGRKSFDQNSRSDRLKFQPTTLTEAFRCVPQFLQGNA
jgi:hypothetical protein